MKVSEHLLCASPCDGCILIFFPSSELIGGNAEQDWLTERNVEEDPTWTEHMSKLCPNFDSEDAETKEGEE